MHALALDTPWGRARLVLLVVAHPVALRFRPTRTLALPAAVAYATLLRDGVRRREVQSFEAAMETQPAPSVDDCLAL